MYATTACILNRMLVFSSGHFLPVLTLHLFPGTLAGAARERDDVRLASRAQLRCFFSFFLLPVLFDIVARTADSPLIELIYIESIFDIRRSRNPRIYVKSEGKSLTTDVKSCFSARSQQLESTNPRGGIFESREMFLLYEGTRKRGVQLTALTFAAWVVRDCSHERKLGAMQPMMEAQRLSRRDKNKSHASLEISVILSNRQLVRLRLRRLFSRRSRAKNSTRRYIIIASAITRLEKARWRNVQHLMWLHAYVITRFNAFDTVNIIKVLFHDAKLDLQIDCYYLALFGINSR